MNVAIKVLGLLVILSLGFFGMKFAEAKNACEQKVMEAQIALYLEPGATAQRDAATEKAFLSDECKRTESLALFVKALGTHNK